MGDEKWMEYLKKFGFGTSTHSGLSGESAGKLPGTNFVDRAMSAFGQAITVTNFQMMKGFSAIANDGSMLQPHYISKIVDKNTGKETITEPQIVGTPIKAQTAQQIRTYMIDTVEDPTYGLRMIFIKYQAIMLLPKQELPRFQMVKGTLMEQVKSCLL